MSESVHVIAIIRPAPGKHDRILSLLKHLCKDVHDKEPYTLRYIATEQINAEDDEARDIVMIETYKDKAAADKHTTEPHFQELFTVFEREALLGKEPYIAKTKSVSGFDLGRKLIG